VHKDTGREVREGETVIASGFGREFFPGVFGLVFVEKEVTK
jgi:hypothetical protein